MTSYYGTPDIVRSLLGVSEADATDEDLEGYLAYATKMTNKFITVSIVSEDIEQSGENEKYYLTENPFIADTNYDKTINASDVSAYYLDENNNKVTLSVSSVDGSTGQVIFTAIPPTDEDPRIDYSYYIAGIDWDLIDLAASYYAAFMWAGKELYLVPPRFFLGNLRMQFTEPWMNYKRMFDEICRIIVSRPIDKVKYNQMVLYPRSLNMVTSEEEWWYKLTGLLS